MLATPDYLASHDERARAGKDALRDATFAASAKADRLRDLAEFLRTRRAVAGGVTREDLTAEGYTPGEIETLLPEAIALAERPRAATTGAGPRFPRPRSGPSFLPDEAEAPGTPCRPRLVLVPAEG